MKLTKVLFIILLTSGFISAQMFPTVGAFRKPELTIESKDLGTLETSATDGSDSLLLTVNARMLYIDSSWTANSVSATIYDSLVVYGESLYVYFDYNLDTTGTIYDTIYIAHTGYGSPAISIIQYEVWGYPSNNYYVSNDGDDDNDGLTPVTAWETITKAVNYDTATGFSAGDTINFDAESVFSLPRLEITSSGTSGSNIVLKTYGEGKAEFDGRYNLSNYALYDSIGSLSYDTLSLDLNSTKVVTNGNDEYYYGYRLQADDGTLTKYLVYSSYKNPVETQVALYTTSDNQNFTKVANSESEVLSGLADGINVYDVQTEIEIDSQYYWVVLTIKEPYGSVTIPLGATTTGDSTYFYHNNNNIWNSTESEATWMNFAATSVQARTDSAAVGIEIRTSGDSSGYIYNTVIANVQDVRVNDTSGVFADKVSYASLDNVNEVTISNDTVYVFNDTLNNIAILDTSQIKLSGDYITMKDLYLSYLDTAVVLDGRGIVLDSIYFLNNNIGFVNNDYNEIKRSTFVFNKTNIANDTLDINTNWFINSGLKDSSTIKFVAGGSNILHNSFVNVTDSGNAYIRNLDGIATMYNNAFENTIMDYIVYSDSAFTSNGNAYSGTYKFDYEGTEYTSPAVYTAAISENTYVSGSDLGFISTYDLNLDSTSALIDEGVVTDITIDHDGNTVPYNSGIRDIGASEYQGIKSSGGEFIVVADYYFDSISGDDSNDGTSESTPKKTATALKNLLNTSAVTSKTIALAANSIFEGNFTIDYGGVEDDSLEIVAYGSGNKPIITSREELEGWDNAANWTQASDADHYPNVWAMYLPCDKAIDRLWLDGEEAKLAAYYKSGADTVARLPRGDNGDGTVGVNSTHRFYYYSSNNMFYVYSPSNPATYYSSMVLPGRIDNGLAENYTILITDDYVKIKNIAVEGGMYASVRSYNNSHITIDSCEIGKYTNFTGVQFRNVSYPRITNSTVDSDWDYDYIFYTERTPYGILMDDNTTYGVIGDCIIKDWWMNIYVIGDAGSPQHFEIYGNDISSTCSFGKAIQISTGGRFEGVQPTYVNFYNNYVHDIVYGMQISGSSENNFYFNIFEDLTLYSTNVHSWSYNTSTGEWYDNYSGGWGAQMIGGVQDAPTPYENNFINNTYNNLIDYAILHDGKYSKYINNLFVNTHTDGTGMTRAGATNDSEFINNLFYTTDGAANDIRVIQPNSTLHTTLTVAELNSTTLSPDRIEGTGNIEYIGNESNLIKSDNTLPSGSPAFSSGADISSYIDAGFKDRWGNTVDRESPNIGANGELP